MSDRTLVLLKPDAVERGLVGQILARFEQKNLKIAALDLRQLDADTLARHYEEHVGKGFYPELVQFMSRGPVVAMVVEGPEDTWEVVRGMMGATNPRKAAPGTIRGDLGILFTENLVHGSDSAASAQRELGIFFPNQDDRGTHINISGAGVAANAPNKDNALKLMEFLASDEAQALYARGYRVTALTSTPVAPQEFEIYPGNLLQNPQLQSSFDLICEYGCFCMLPPSERSRYVEAATRILRPGGQLFGSFLERADEPNRAAPYGSTAAELLRIFAPHFDVIRLEPSAFHGPHPDYSQLEAIFVRR